MQHTHSTYQKTTQVEEYFTSKDQCYLSLSVYILLITDCETCTLSANKSASKPKGNVLGASSNNEHIYPHDIVRLHLLFYPFRVISLSLFRPF